MAGDLEVNPDNIFSQFDSSAHDAVQSVLESQILWRGNGPRWGMGHTGVCATDDFEDAFAEWLGLPFVLAVNSGTSANEAAVASLGLEPGTEVVCPAASPIFVPYAVLAAGCIPVFADVDKQTLTPTVESIKHVVNERTGAIVVVHLWGRPAPIEEILQFSRQHNLKIVEDCAQALATTLNGRRLGTFGDVACFSLQHSKLISSGEGGVFATAGRAPYARAAQYSNSGIPYLRYGVEPAEGGGSPTAISSFGHNHRMGELQAAVALSQLRRVDKLVERRRKVVSALEGEFDRAGVGELFRLPPVANADISYWRYPIRVSATRGNYVGLPPLEPFFQQMEVTRKTPFGLNLPDHVSYNISTIPGAVEGSKRIRILPVRADMSDDDGRLLAQNILELAH